jgi:predicted nucleic-acid-binding protein
VPVTVLLELEWVLRSRYRLGRAGLIGTLDALLSVPALAFAEEAAVERALWRFKRDRRSDFADCLHVALAEAADTLPLVTFDVRAGSLPGARPIPA